MVQVAASREEEEATARSGSSRVDLCTRVYKHSQAAQQETTQEASDGVACSRLLAIHSDPD